MMDKRFRAWCPLSILLEYVDGFLCELYSIMNLWNSTHLLVGLKKKAAMCGLRAMRAFRTNLVLSRNSLVSTVVVGQICTASKCLNFISWNYVSGRLGSGQTPMRPPGVCRLIVCGAPRCCDIGVPRTARRTKHICSSGIA